MPSHHTRHTRRDFLTDTGRAGLGLTAGSLLSRAACAMPTGPVSATKPPIPPGTAKHCILIWLGGGACHIDTWDPKRRGDVQTKKPGSYYKAIETAVAGTRVSEHLPRCAAILDRFNILRTVHHEVIDEHAAAVNRVHTGRPTGGTIIYPSIGSIVAQQRGPVNRQAPAYVLIGYPNVTRGPGFLGSKYGYLYLTDTHSGPAGFTRAADVNRARQDRRERLLARMRGLYLRRVQGGQSIADYDSTVGEALRLSGPKFMNVFQLDREPAERRRSYGGEFGQRCLLARRLLEAGVRFVEVSHNMNFVNGTGWDIHNQGHLNQHVLIRELDSALSSLILDLERNKMLDETLVVVATEFGRPATFDGGGGRGHYSKAFSIVLAGGGLQNGRTIGVTDDFGMKIESRPITIPDLHATLYNALGIDPLAQLYTSDDRPVPITDGGRPVRELFV